MLQACPEKQRCVNQGSPQGRKTGLAGRSVARGALRAPVAVAHDAAPTPAVRMVPMHGEDYESEALVPMHELPALNGLPFLGITTSFASDANPSFDIRPFFEEYGEHFVAHLGPGVGKSLVTRNPDEIRGVLTRANEFKMRWPRQVEKLAWPDKYLAPNEEVAPWKAAMAQILHSRAVMALHLPVMVSNTEAIIQRVVEDGGEVPWRKEAERITFTNSIQTILGDVLSEEEIEWVLPLIGTRDRGYTSLDFGLPDGLPFTQYQKAANARDTLREFFAAKIESIVQDPASFDREGTVLGRFLTMLEKEGRATETTTNSEIAGMLAGWIDFVQLAAADAPGYSITRVVKWLAVHPEWLDALWEEQERLMQEYGDVIDRRVVSRSAVGMAVVQESLRLTPAFWAIQRRALQPAVVGGVLVPAGTNIVLAIGEAMKSTGNGSLAFDPAQWLSSDHSEVTINEDKGNVMFSVGARGCPGKDLTIIELAVAVVVFARKVKGISMNEVEMNRPLNTALTWPSDVPMKFEAR